MQVQISFLKINFSDTIFPIYEMKPHWSFEVYCEEGTMSGQSLIVKVIFRSVAKHIEYSKHGKKCRQSRYCFMNHYSSFVPVCGERG